MPYRCLICRGVGYCLFSRWQRCRNCQGSGQLKAFAKDIKPRRLGGDSGTKAVSLRPRKA